MLFLENCDIAVGISCFLWRLSINLSYVDLRGIKDTKFDVTLGFVEHGLFLW